MGIETICVWIHFPSRVPTQLSRSLPFLSLIPRAGEGPRSFKIRQNHPTYHIKGSIPSVYSSVLSYTHLFHSCSYTQGQEISGQ